MFLEQPVYTGSVNNLRGYDRPRSLMVLTVITGMTLRTLMAVMAVMAMIMVKKVMTVMTVMTVRTVMTVMTVMAVMTVRTVLHLQTTSLCIQEWLLVKWTTSLSSPPIHKIQLEEIHKLFLRLLRIPGSFQLNRGVLWDLGSLRGTPYFLADVNCSSGF